MAIHQFLCIYQGVKWLHSNSFTDTWRISLWRGVRYDVWDEWIWGNSRTYDQGTG